ADVSVVLHHAVGIGSQTGHALGLLLQMREDVHARRVPPYKERLPIGSRLIDELESPIKELLVNSLHALGVQRPRVLDLLRAVGVGPALEYAARPELFPELGIFRIVRIFRFLFCIEVIKVAKELVESMCSR